MTEKLDFADSVALPIADAPMDGTPILVCCRRKNSFAKARWYAKSEDWILAVPSEDWIERLDFTPHFWKHLTHADS